MAAREDDRRALERMCAVSRAVRPVDELIRFVRAPDGSVVADVRRRLPGRGVWVSADRGSVAQALKRGAFARGFKAPATPAADLADVVERQLRTAALDALSLANKAGAVVTGFDGVTRALAHDPVVAVLHASDGAPDGLRKVATHARHLPAGSAVPEGLGAPGIFTIDEMSLALGRENVVHAALKHGGAALACLARMVAVMRYVAPVTGAVTDGTGGKPPASDPGTPGNNG